MFLWENFPIVLCERFERKIADNILFAAIVHPPIMDLSASGINENEIICGAAIGILLPKRSRKKTK